MDLNEILVFARVVQAGSFTTAAAELGMPKSTVSRKITELEGRLKARLLNRSTRKVSLTDVGRTYYDYCLTKVLGRALVARVANAGPPVLLRGSGEPGSDRVLAITGIGR